VARMTGMAKGDSKSERTQSPQSQLIKWDSGAGHRIVAADGVWGWGGVTGAGTKHLVLYFYSERPPLPETSERVLADGQVKEIVHKGAPDLVRTVEVAVRMDLAIAEDVRKWLDERIEELRKFSAVKTIG
jgi:hypothetical protein